MSNGIAVYLRAQDLPDGEWLGRLVASMEPTFAFAEGFDPENDDGWVPCRIGETECGFEWEFGEIESLPAELEGRRFDRVAGLHWRSDANDAICAVLVAANLAHVAHGVVVALDGRFVEGGAAKKWATQGLRELKKKGRVTRSKAKPRPGPRPLLDGWLQALPGAKVARFVRMLPDDPLMGVGFDTGLRLQGKRWTVIPAGREPLTTRTFPREMSREQVRSLARASDALGEVFNAGPVLAASFDEAALELRFELSGGTLILHPQAEHYATAYEAMFRGLERWELSFGEARVAPEVDEGRLAADWFDT